MLEVIYLLAADVDVQGAYDFFEEQREGRGDDFLRQLRQLEVLLLKDATQTDPLFRTLANASRHHRTMV